MWTVMMAAMMLPSLVPMLVRYRRAVGEITDTCLDALTALVGVAYFFVWTLFGAIVFPLGAGVAAVTMPQPQIAAGVVVLIAASLQFTAWKARRLAWCRETPSHENTLTADARAAWSHGLCLGLHCAESCAGLMAILLVIGVMDLRAMAIVTSAITVERLAPDGMRIARAIGAVGVGAGLSLIVLAVAR
jgi:predicted metal-binding membrane protein